MLFCVGVYTWRPAVNLSPNWEHSDISIEIPEASDLYCRCLGVGLYSSAPQRRPSPASLS